MVVVYVEDQQLDAILLRYQLGGVDPEITLRHVLDPAELDAATLDDAALILVDLGLPGREDLEALEEIRRIAPEVPAMVASGNPDPELRRRALAAGAVGFLQKGAPPGEAAEALRRAAGTRR